MTVSVPISRAIATWFGCGYSRVAPGTVGSLGALPLHYALNAVSQPLRWAVVFLLTLLGAWSAHQTARAHGTHDPQIVVIDEVVGVLIALSLVQGHGFTSEVLALVLFRILDITKPGPIRLAERAKPTGLGIMLDDVVAGFVAGFVIRWVR